MCIRDRYWWLRNAETITPAAPDNTYVEIRRKLQGVGVFPLRQMKRASLYKYNTENVMLS